MFERCCCTFSRCQYLSTQVRSDVFRFISLYRICNLDVADCQVSVIGYCDLVGNRLAKYVLPVLCPSRTGCCLFNSQARVRIFRRVCYIVIPRVGRVIGFIITCCRRTVLYAASQDILLGYHVLERCRRTISRCQLSCTQVRSDVCFLIPIYRICKLDVADCQVSVIGYFDLVCDRLAKYVLSVLCRRRAGCCLINSQAWIRIDKVIDFFSSVFGNIICCYNGSIFICSS